MFPLFTGYSCDPSGPRCIPGPDAEQEVEFGAMWLMGPHPHLGGGGENNDTILRRARLLEQGWRVGVKSRGPKERTRSHLSTPNAMAPGREQVLGGQRAGDPWLNLFPVSWHKVLFY